MVENKLFKDIFDILPFSVYVVDIDTMDVIYINQQYKNRLNIKENQKCYQNIYARDNKCEFCKISNILNTKDNMLTFELFNDFDDCWYQITEKIVTVNNQRLKYSIAVDISSHKSTQKELSEAHAQLLLKKIELDMLNATLEEKIKKEVAQRVEKEQELIKKDKLLQESKMSAMSEMIFMLSHQWRQPLSAIMVNADAMKLKNSLNRLEDGDIEKHSTNIKKITKDLASIIDDFSKLFRQDKKGDLLKLDEVIVNICELNKELIEKNNINIKLNLNSDKTFILSFTEVSQVILNVLKNAIEAFFEIEDREKIIEINTFDKDNYTQLEIIDNGCGISDEDIDKIYEPYFSTKSYNKKGLGLYFANIIVKEQLNGTIEVDNKDKTKFTIRLYQ